MTAIEKIDDRYEVLEQIGRGGQAVIYRALDTRMEREVALKVVSFPRLQDEEEVSAILDMFRHEILVSGQVTHTNVVNVHDFGLDKEAGAAFMVMQLLHGATIKEQLEKEGPPAPEIALRIMQSLINAVDYLHQNGVVHRDLKPSNVFLNHGEPVIIDFGISTSKDKTVTITGSGLAGSQRYLCPEMINPRAVDRYRGHPRRDIWGLGMIGYELCTGEPYFDAEADSGEIIGLLSNTRELLRDMGRRMSGHPLRSLVLEMLKSEEILAGWASQLRGVHGSIGGSDPLQGSIRRSLESADGPAPAAPAANQPVAAYDEYATKFCLICGKSAPAGFKRCERCGSQHFSTVKPDKVVDPSNINPQKWIVDKINLVLMALGILALLFIIMAIVDSCMY